MQFHLELTEAILMDWCGDLTRSQREKILNETPLTSQKATVSAM